MRILLLGALLITSQAFAVTWEVTIKDSDTSEVKTYQFTESKTHTLELPKFKHQACVFEVEKPQTKNGFTLQMVEARCFLPGGGVWIREICFDPATESDKFKPATFQVFEDGTQYSKEDGKVVSYLVQIQCK